MKTEDLINGLAAFTLFIAIIFIAEAAIENGEKNECRNWKPEEITQSWQVEQCKNYEIPIATPEPTKPIQESEAPTQARITKYGWTGNTMANGEYPYIGAVASSDRSIPLGTIVEIDGKEYTVKDRTAKWVHEKFGSTFDIYSEDSYEEMMEFGSQKMVVIIK